MRGVKHNAFGKFAISERARVLFYRCAIYCSLKGDRLADILTAETGGQAEVYGNVLFLFVGNAIGTCAKKSESDSATDPDQNRISRWSKPKKLSPATHRVASSASSARWNFPLVLTLGEAIPALMAGNAVVIKPSELTPLSAIFGAELARQSRLSEKSAANRRRLQRNRRSADRPRRHDRVYRQRPNRQAGHETSGGALDSSVFGTRRQRSDDRPPKTPISIAPPAPVSGAR
jgi:hypothetical protein